ncbi:MAG: class II aldolase/adducin family protein [Betaproteobacteria bacterium]|nr:class II aldolase/adducin family protein [Betaproteobacteria bacterium]
MESLWNDMEAARFRGELGARVYASRLLGRDTSLVLHGGGNTSVKIGDILHVKGSGSDLAVVDEGAFAPLHLECVKRVLARERLDNVEMMRLLDACLARRPAPKPSIETLLHAALPFRYVEHTHADTVLAVVNTEDGERIAADLYGELAPLVPYHHSGVELASACRAVLSARGTQRTIGLVLRFHGIVAFGDSARASYENMIRLVTIAEDYLKAKGAWELNSAAQPLPRIDRMALAALRAAASRAAGFPLVMRTERDPLCIAFTRRDDLRTVSQQGPATPQHAVFTKRLPQVGRDVDAFERGYRDYLRRTLGSAADARLDSAPRIVLDAVFGLCALGVNAEYAHIAAECYRHDIEIIVRASAHDVYRAAPERAIAQAELEYGGFERALRERVSRDQPLLGQVALIAPAAHRVQPELPQQLLAQGAAVSVIGGPQETGGIARPAFCMVPDNIEAALDQTVAACGGLDRLYAEPVDEPWVNAVAPLLALSPVAGGIMRSAHQRQTFAQNRP